MQELLVVRHEDDRTRKCCERTLERFDRTHIKMVRRLIENEQIRFSQQLLGDEQFLQLSRADVRSFSQCSTCSGTSFRTERKSVVFPTPFCPDTPT